MIETVVFMLAGAFVFASGIAFEKLIHMNQKEESEEVFKENRDEMNEEMLKQWENLLGYDGNEKEDTYENI